MMWVMTSSKVLVNMAVLQGLGLSTHEQDRKIDEGTAVLRTSAGILEAGPEQWVKAAFALIAAGLANGRTFVDLEAELGEKPKPSRLVV